MVKVKKTSLQSPGAASPTRVCIRLILTCDVDLSDLSRYFRHFAMYVCFLLFFFFTSDML